MDERYNPNSYNQPPKKIDYSNEKFELKFNKPNSNDISSHSPSSADGFHQNNSAFLKQDVFSEGDVDLASNQVDSNSYDISSNRQTPVSNAGFYGSTNSQNKATNSFENINPNNAYTENVQNPQRNHNNFADAQNGSLPRRNLESGEQMKNQTPPTGASRIPSELRKPADVSRVPSELRKPTGTPVRQANSPVPPSRAVPPENGNNASSKKKKKKKKGKKIIGLIFSLLIIVLVSCFAFGYSLLGNLTYDADFIDENQYIDSSLLFSDDSLINILFLGSDEREDLGSSRSDTMMLCTIDTANKEIKLTSFLRDSYVYIPSVGYSTKLNAAFSYGGAQLAIDTIEYNFKVDIDNYVMVDFETFELLVDLLGGITVDDVTTAEADYMNDVVKISGTPLVEGTNEMDGNTALWYCRIRYLDSDFYRTERQRKVIESIIDKISETDFLTLIEIMEEVLPNVSTNISQNEIVSLAFKAISCLSYDITQMQIPVDGTWYNDTINSQAVLVMDIDENAQLLEEFLSNPAEEDEE